MTSRKRKMVEPDPPTKTPEEIGLARSKLRGSVLWYDEPFEPAEPVEAWTVNQQFIEYP